DAAAFRRFTAPEITDLHEANGIHGIGEACERIERAIRDREGILIYGDYDVDGVTSIVLLQTVLRLHGADAGFVVPHRVIDGYGLKIEVLERVLAERDIKLVITVDCGITSVEPVRRAIERGIDVIVTDHHLPPGTLPSAAAVLNPKQDGCTYPFKELAGVGVAFKLCCELIRRSGRKVSLDSLLRIAALGTIADVAPLIGENRTIAALGLRGLSGARNRGLRALLRRSGLEDRAVRSHDVGFKLGPRINAAGRLASADTAIELFAAATDEAAWALAGELDRLNSQRQEVERDVRIEAETQVDPNARVLVLAGHQWHKGVVGLTAGRIAQKFHRPALVMSTDGTNAVGSARSIPSINLHEQLERVSDLFTHFGGHEFACGFSLPAANIEALRERLTASFDELEADRFVRRANVDGTLRLHDVDPAFVSEHELLQPFGSGNSQPMFVASGVTAVNTREFAEDCHEVTLQDDSGSAKAVVWPSASAVMPIVRGAGADVLFQVEPDRFDGARLVVVDARPS
ncbi:MAG: single-stranded-DNA-specific exonuclease RecJ, partial [Thermoanaerobaculia bacterium]